jgi:hypothetical protein
MEAMVNFENEKEFPFQSIDELADYINSEDWKNN